MTLPEGHAPFALWNRSGNRLVAALLRGPLHPLVSRHLILLTVTGRRSGAPHTFPVGYRRAGNRLTIPVMLAERKLWWRNLIDGAPVSLRLRGDSRTGNGTAVIEGEGKVTVEVVLD